MYAYITHTMCMYIYNIGTFIYLHIYIYLYTYINYLHIMCILSWAKHHHIKNSWPRPATVTPWRGS